MERVHIDINLGPDHRVEARFGGLAVTTAQDGSSPTPFELFLASIGTCVGFYVSQFCASRGIPLAGIRIRQTALRDPESHRVDPIDIEIELPEGFPERYRAAVLRAADGCLVKQHILAPPEIRVHATERAAAAAPARRR